ncbi:SMI1/KNR4 family protein [Aequorivita marisscotiae]|uniref:SMI1/KNR4 family protein n=1 Tax=Aequorivita marisscotiae TaxID=3040348 RepID=A0ABY8KY28_9FLAO|nr:SMI1/KNR4 family protein [Aequorivita sp. Ant34-E75]WGF94018.1 SMI1/KNR4 family protein [Aequorivita sp. Ant34-E75]
MNSLLKQISEKAIELADFEFTQEQTENKWLGTKPASENEIQLTEKRLGIDFPTDFKQFMSITNGFSAPNDIEPTFEPINKIDFLKNIDSFIIETYSLNGIENIGIQLEKSIIVGGINQEQYFLLIPPNSTNEKWKYWKFANWHPGEEEHENLESYFKEVLSFLNETIESEKN